MPTETFKAKIIDSWRVTIPEENRPTLNANIGDIVKVTIETIKTKFPDGEEQARKDIKRGRV